MSFLFAIRCALWALAIMIPVTTLAASSDQSAQAVEKLVDVEGYKLNFRTIPGQGPVIPLEFGGGMDSAEWAAIAPPCPRRIGSDPFGECGQPDIDQ